MLTQKGSYQITFIFDMWININERVYVSQDWSSLIIEGGFSR